MNGTVHPRDPIAGTVDDDGPSALQLDGSLVICTRNRADQLVQCLESLTVLDAIEHWELVLVDNGSTDHTRAVIDAFGARYPHRLVVIHERRPGLGRARNAGLAAARGPLIAFTDDDCYPAGDFLVELKRVFEDEGVGYLGGRILLHNPDDAPVSIRLTPKPWPIPAYSFVHTGLIQGANMACRRALVDSIGGFDEDFGAGTPFPAEDVEFIARASAAGWHGGYFPGPTVSHDHGRRGDHVVRHLFRQYDLGRGAYLAKFILRSDTRGLYSRHWYWSINLRRGKRRLRNEVQGALHYLCWRAWRRLFGPRA